MSIIRILPSISQINRKFENFPFCALSNSLKSIATQYTTDTKNHYFNAAVYILSISPNFYLLERICKFHISIFSKICQRYISYQNVMGIRAVYSRDISKTEGRLNYIILSHFCVCMKENIIQFRRNRDVLEGIL